MSGRRRRWDARASRGSGPRRGGVAARRRDPSAGPSARRRDGARDRWPRRRRPSALAEAAAEDVAPDVIVTHRPGAAPRRRRRCLRGPAEAPREPHHGKRRRNAEDRRVLGQGRPRRMAPGHCGEDGAQSRTVHVRGSEDEGARRRGLARRRSRARVREGARAGPLRRRVQARARRPRRERAHDPAPPLHRRPDDGSARTAVQDAALHHRASCRRGPREDLDEERGHGRLDRRVRRLRRRRKAVQGERLLRHRQVRADPSLSPSRRGGRRGGRSRGSRRGRPRGSIHPAASR